MFTHWYLAFPDIAAKNVNIKVIKLSCTKKIFNVNSPYTTCEDGEYDICVTWSKEKTLFQIEYGYLSYNDIWQTKKIPIVSYLESEVRTNYVIHY